MLPSTVLGERFAAAVAFAAGAGAPFDTPDLDSASPSPAHMLVTGQPLLGGDLEFSLIHQQATDAQMAFIASKGEVSKVATVRGMALTDDNTALVEVKAVDLPIEIVSTMAWSPAARVAERYSLGRAHLVGDAAHLPELLHQVHLVVQAAGGVGQHEVGVAGGGGREAELERARDTERESEPGVRAPVGGGKHAHGPRGRSAPRRRAPLGVPHSHLPHYSLARTERAAGVALDHPP